jgi:hypothetical protein
MPDHVWQVVSMDYKGPLPGNVMLNIIQCNYSRYPFATECSSTSFTVLVPKMEKIFSEHGYPSILKTDNGPQFNGFEFTKYCNQTGIQHKKITPLWPEANGLCERFMPGIEKVVKMAHLKGTNWRKDLNEFLLNYRATPHSTTEVSPAELFLGRSIKTRPPQIYKSKNSTVDKLAQLHENIC